MLYLFYTIIFLLLILDVFCSILEIHYYRQFRKDYKSLIELKKELKKYGKICDEY